MGNTEDEPCERNGCNGVIRVHPVENCSCHISPPCAACTSPREFCFTCGWEAINDMIFNDHIVHIDKSGVWKAWSLRPLNHSKIDWHSKSHTHFSMIKEGVYPEGTTMKQVEEAEGE